MRVREILLTGATGFLGAELLARLLTGPGDRRVTCVLRGSSDEAIAARGVDALSAALRRAPYASELRRITWTRGDLERAGLGMNPDQLSSLALRIGEIFHCAASTKFDLSLGEAERINVHGTREVLALARRAAASGEFRRLHHVSTAFAAGRRRGRVLAGELPPDRARHFRNTYERTKARAERLLRAQREVPVTIYRPSIIVGDSRDGVTRSWNVLYYPMRLIASRRLPIAPSGGSALLDCVPIDFVADAILALAGRDDTTGATLHLVAGRDAATVPWMIQEIAAGLARSGDPLPPVIPRTVGPARWWIVQQGYRLFGGARARAVATRFAQYAPYTRIDARFDDARERQLLAISRVRLTPPATFVPRIIDYALAANFGRATPRPEPAGDAAWSAAG
jgi:thioester reductase-like protein